MNRKKYSKPQTDVYEASTASLMDQSFTYTPEQGGAQRSKRNQVWDDEDTD